MEQLKKLMVSCNDRKPPDDYSIVGLSSKVYDQKHPLRPSAHTSPSEQLGLLDDYSEQLTPGTCGLMERTDGADICVAGHGKRGKGRKPTSCRPLWIRLL